MFHRRLVLLLAVMVCASMVLGGQMVRLTVLQGDRWRQRAEANLMSQSFVDTVRGKILDSKDRELALDEPCFDVAVDYSVITGQWAFEQAESKARKEHKHEWAELAPDRREQLTSVYQGTYDDQLERFWNRVCQVGGIDRAELEGRRKRVIEKVSGMQAVVWQRQARAYDQPVGLRKVAIKIAEERQAHTLLPDVSSDVAYAFPKLPEKVGDLAKLFKKLHVRRGTRRAYPFNALLPVILDRSTLPKPLRDGEEVAIEVTDVGRAVIGSTRDEVWAEDERDRPFRLGGGRVDLKGYRRGGDRVGNRGVEKAAEDRLRGSRGRRLHHKDTAETNYQPPVPGQDVRLTLDIQLQGRIRAIMDERFGLMRIAKWQKNEDMPVGTPLNGAAIVLEVDTGNVLAMVSADNFTRYWLAEQERIKKLAEQKRMKQMADQGLDEHQDASFPDPANRVISAAYPPGSTIKPIVYCLAAAEAVIAPNEVIRCDGHLFPNNQKSYRCWIYRERFGFRTHGDLQPVEAIARSCNIYFYNCGRRLGPQRLTEGLGRFGFGQRAETGLGEEITGMIRAGERTTRDEATMMGIGQVLAVPPIQLAAAHAAIARGGYYLSPILIKQRAEQQVSRDLRIPPNVINNVLKGMYEAANEQHGTAHHISGPGVNREPILNVPNVICRGKTGTAQSSIQFQDVNQNGKFDTGDRVIRRGTHAWYVLHAQRPGEVRAAFVIVVLVEYGGSGSRAAGPVANQILHALRQEGYL